MGNQNSSQSKKAEADLEKKRRKERLCQQETRILYGDTQDDDVDEVKGHDPGDPVDTTDCSFSDLKARYLRTHSNKDALDMAAFDVDPRDYKYPFENLVFEGGGNKGLAYVGAVQRLTECGILGQIRRMGGASAGAITAAFVAMGYTWEELYDFVSCNMEELLLDHSCGYFSLLPNLISNFGWNPGKKIHRWFGDKIKAKSARDDPDMTFYDLYKEKNLELCVMVTNLNLMTSEYCHPKTTPEMPIRDALCMTLAIPGLFAAKKYDNRGQEDTFVDGGMLCNYPIQCFDGWYLSMDPQDSFLQRCRPLKDLPQIMCPSSRFYPSVKIKTLGFLLYDDTEKEVLRYNLEKRIGSVFPHKPEEETKLFKERAKKKETQEKAEREHARTVTAVDAFMKVLSKVNRTEVKYIDKEELKTALKDDTLTQAMKDRLFGQDCTLDTAFSILDKDGNNKITFFELIAFIEEHGLRMQTRFQGYGRQNIKSFLGFLEALQNSLLVNLKYVCVSEDDVDRTVGINTGHVGCNDYTLEEADREFICKRGYYATDTYLRYFVAERQAAITKSQTGAMSNGVTAENREVTGENSDVKGENGDVTGENGDVITKEPEAASNGVKRPTAVSPDDKLDNLSFESTENTQGKMGTSGYPVPETQKLLE